jgi:hypothetical protein
MWVAKKPNLQSSIDDIDNVIKASSKKITDADKPIIEKLYRDYERQNGIITQDQHKVFDTSKAKALYDLYGQTYKDQKLYYIRKELFRGTNKCPYCSINLPETLDHYMAESEYKELAVCRLNLVPMCWTCNSKKRAGNVSDFVHPYYSGLPTGVQFFVCHTNVDDNDNLSWNFGFDSSVLEESLYDTLKKQVSKTDALPRIMAESNTFVSDNFANGYDCDEALASYIEYLMESYKQYGQNDWRNALLYAFKTNQDITANVINNYIRSNPSPINSGFVI